jgi:hypothetical protein
MITVDDSFRFFDTCFYTRAGEMPMRPEQVPCLSTKMVMFVMIILDPLPYLILLCFIKLFLKSSGYLFSNETDFQTFLCNL